MYFEVKVLFVVGVEHHECASVFHGTTHTLPKGVADASG
jgi:hypothetical protein